MAVLHADAIEEAQRLKEHVASEFNCGALWISEFSPIMGYTTGRGLLGLALFSDHDGNAEIYVMDEDGSNHTRITDNPASDDCPVWAP